MEVTVSAAVNGCGVRVVHEGHAHDPGETVDVPEDVARDWIAQGWATGEFPSTIPKTMPPDELSSLKSAARKDSKRKPAAKPVRSRRKPEPVIFVGGDPE